MKRSRRPVTLVAATILALTLSGCSFGGSLVGGTDGGGSSGGSTGDGSPTGSTTETTTGSGDNGLEDYVGMPDTFPAGVPIIDGDVVFGIDLGTGWSIIVESDDIAADCTGASDKLAGAGFSSDISSTTADGSFGSFSSAAYTVQVTATDSADYGPSVQYVVIKNS